MMEFDLIRPSTLNQACEILAQYGDRARIIAGGTDLLVNLRKEQRMGNLELIVDITGLQGLNNIEQRGERIHIGPLVTHCQAAESQLLQTLVPFLAEACSSIGSPQIRHRGTLGGSLCNASPAGDPLPPLAALDAQVTLHSVSGERELPVSEFITGPYQTAMRGDELLTDIVFDVPRGAKTAFIKLGRRKALAVARMSVAVMAMLEGGRVSDIRIATGAVMPSVMRVKAAEELLLGKAPVTEEIARAAQAMAEEMIRVSGRRWSTPYKEPVVQVLARRALSLALEVE